MQYIIYKITNKINGKFYIGKHQTNDLDDGYMGSGKLLKRAIKKYGIENFEKEILHVFETEEEMNQKEKEFVTEEFCSRNDTYNICQGGQGGFGYINKNGMNNKNNNTEEIRNIQRNKGIIFGRKSFFLKVGIHNPKYQKNRSEWSNLGNKFKGKKHSDETKQKMKLNVPNRFGSNNQSFGTMWVTNGIDNKKILRYNPIPDGYWKGRCLSIISVS